MKHLVDLDGLSSSSSANLAHSSLFLELPGLKFFASGQLQTGFSSHWRPSAKLLGIIGFTEISLNPPGPAPDGRSRQPRKSVSQRRELVQNGQPLSK